MPTALKLVSVNIERSKHLELIRNFLQREQGELVCMQELCERDIPLIEEIAGPCRAYVPITLHPGDAPESTPLIVGTGIFTRLPVNEVMVHFYRGSESGARSEPVKKTMQDISLIRCDLKKGDEAFRVVTTHFTWTPDGKPSDEQRADMKAFIHELDSYGDFVLAGDFNAPRGGEIFDTLAAHYKDNIPAHYAVSIDASLHRAGALPYMVDGLFTTPGYKASDVHLVEKVSDHMAIVAHVSKS